MEQREKPQYYADIISGMAERTIRRLWITIILLIALLVGSNTAWLIYEAQFEEVTTTETYEATTDGGGTAIANGSGEVTYGTS